MQSPMSGNVQIPMPWKYSMESYIILRLWAREEIRTYLENQAIPRA